MKYIFYMWTSHQIQMQCLWIKIYWNAAMPMHLHIVYG